MSQIQLMFLIQKSVDPLRMNITLTLLVSIKNTQTINAVCIAIGPDDVIPQDYENVFDHVVKINNVGLKHPMANE